MLIKERIGVLASFELRGRVVDVLDLEWYETGKRIMRKRTRSGREVAMRFMNERPELTEGDVLYADMDLVVVVSIVPCAVMVIRMGSLYGVAAVCYEIGNRHLPLYYEGDELLAPYEEPLYRWLVAGGHGVSRDERKLLRPLRSTVAGHVHAEGGLLSRILKVRE
ncbi:urease accessory protein UreE [Flavitalea sp. BT771]|uniref:urease accessory protein UreE n=1 Tax=Flavitalea sp. BT771 TaxID=3063329 RepID=UPI0026E2B3C9|nr:urease accessory protein UreE [Flavitalea sp. BT771]MDO6431909.1 urease accessory protein UreE [Flavitalea sp. BT771]MDV6220818.1 urease accessory protein UreE [Flavitalea sp. BT771]